VRFEILERDGLARTGVLEIDGIRHRTPAVAHVLGEGDPRIMGGLRLSPHDAAGKGDLKLLPSAFAPAGEGHGKDGALDPWFRGSPYAETRPEGGFVVMDGVAKLILDSPRFVDAIKKAKSGPDLLKPMFCSLAGLPHRLALLVYCGADVFDSVPLVMASETGSYLTATGPLAYSELKDLPCTCEACRSGVRGKQELLRHNIATADAELRLVSHMVSQGRLRELVETRVRTDPWLVQDLRLMDMHAYELQEMHAPVKGTAFHAGSKESLLRPEIVRWQHRLRERYRRPEDASVLLLIPCSAKKPYSLSQSHMRFRDAIFSSGRASQVHEVIVTSPLGLVPRELEMFYPAQDYDIPVTGHWDRDEQKLAQDMVSWLIETQGYDLVVSHLGDERGAVADALGDHIDTSSGEPGSRASLDRLEQALREQCPEPKDPRREDRVFQDIRSVCRFQFGRPGEDLCDGAHSYGRWPFVKVVKERTQLGMMTPDRGMVSLTLDGARVLARTGAYCVEIEDFKPKGNLFAVGVEGSSPDVRVGDDVAVVHRGDARAVGVAKMCAAEMRLAERGEAVHIRHAA
jgi:archaeosine synthase